MHHPQQYFLKKMDLHCGVFFKKKLHGGALEIQPFSISNGQLYISGKVQMMTLNVKFSSRA